jgi:hypothetical protein
MDPLPQFGQFTALLGRELFVTASAHGDQHRCPPWNARPG